MLTFVRYDDEILLQYEKREDCYSITEDDLLGFPYEAYEPIQVFSDDYYELFLDDKASYPTVKEDRWYSASVIVEKINSYASSTASGVQRMNDLSVLMQEYLRLREPYQG